jgi:hypothetical protein
MKPTKAKRRRKQTTKAKRRSLKSVKATWKNGHIVPDEPVDWPEGCWLRVEPVNEEETLGIREEDWPTDPEGIAKLIERRRKLKPLVMTEEEHAELEAVRRAHKEFEKANFHKRAKKIKELFE